MEAISFISEVDTGLNSHAWLAYKISFVVGAYEWRGTDLSWQLSHHLGALSHFRLYEFES